MSSYVSKSLQVPSPLNMMQDSYRSKEKQGIVAILGSDSERTKIEPSLRRTLSADMSSQKWISHMKKVASSEEISAQNNDERTEELGLWNSIQEEKKEKEAAQNDVWSSIISQKDVDSSKSITPYVHPLVKRSASSLSEKSLEICTESLGSETGSDGFSSYPQSENGDADEDDDKEEHQHDETQTFEEEWESVKHSYKKSPSRSFPPPLPSLSCPDGGSSRMQLHRNNGRLVLEAMAVPSQNNFLAQRQDGRLVLTLVNSRFIEQVVSKEEKQEDEFEKIFSYSDDEKGDEQKTEEEETKEDEPEGESIIMEKAPELSSGLLNVHILAVMMNSKSIVLATRNQSTPIVDSLPPRPKVAQPISYCSPPTATAAASLNAYEYYWRSKPATKAAVAVNPLAQQPQSFKNSGRKLIVCKNRTANEQQRLVLSNSTCKEFRRSLLFWEPHCIATS